MRSYMADLILKITMNIFILAVVITAPLAALAVQQDAEYYVQEKRFGEQWAAEDKQVREKLAALEKYFSSLLPRCSLAAYVKYHACSRSNKFFNPRL